MLKLTIQTTLRIKEKEYAKIQKIAEIQERSINKQIEFILYQFIKEYEKVNGKIKIEEEE